MSIFSKRFWIERDVELYIGKLLRYGVILSSIITILGGIIYVSQHPHEVPNFKTFTGAPEYLRELSTIFPKVLQFDGLAIIQLGVAVLIATPILRIVFSILAFAIEHDYMYVIITCIVLSIILANLFFGIES
ncbi:DUF1634 domain-containing protein [Apibacter adventoris]|uniref:DUF1634 domain-containing protein n=1 Tax=Apibacter adventoris TaxID=1679466 RepID=UPI000CF64832|nr:DUF1634 domain-containing protein [Apibacter adventoris]PQL92439.1 DUF1634 domain-containing protein [Apibacter adventoris]